MALSETQIGGTSTERIFLGCDYSKPWKVADYDTDSTGATAKNITGWAITFEIRRAASTSTALLTKTVGSGLTISGSFNSVLATSTQVVTLALADTDLTTATFGSLGGRFMYSLKRTDDTFETILAYGPIVLERATQV